jgi:K+-transporting ATPase A subunit
MKGKEVRFGIAASGLWATATTAAPNGSVSSVNSIHDSYTPLGGLVPMVLIQLGEVFFGGVGSGLYGMLIFTVLAVFVAGLMTRSGARTRTTSCWSPCTARPLGRAMAETKGFVSKTTLTP